MAAISGKDQANQAGRVVVINGAAYVPDKMKHTLKTKDAFGLTYVLVHDGHVWTAGNSNGPFGKGPKLGTPGAENWLK